MQMIYLYFEMTFAILLPVIELLLRDLKSVIREHLHRALLQIGCRQTTLKSTGGTRVIALVERRCRKQFALSICKQEVVSVIT